MATKDRSSTGFTATLHVTSKDKTKAEFSCRISRAVLRVKIASAATTELMGYPLAMSLLASYLEATYFAWSTYKDHYHIFIMGDAQSTLHEGMRLLTPYVWKVKGMGKVKKEVRKNDIIFVRPIQKLALVKDISTT